jgi:hypothetical protein
MSATDYLAANFEAVPALIVFCLEMRTVKKECSHSGARSARDPLGKFGPVNRRAIAESVHWNNW